VAVERDGKKEMISLSILKPLVHRSKFFPDEFSVTRTCSELLSTRGGDSLTLVIQSVDSNFKDLSVVVDGVPTDSSLIALEQVGMNIYDVGLLTECEQLIDVEKRTRHSVDIDAKQLYDLRFRKIHEYSRLATAISELDVSDHDWTRETWTICVSTPEKRKNEINWWIKSAGTGRVWKKKVFDYNVNYALSIDEVVSDFEERVEQIVPLEHISGFTEVVARLKDTFSDRGWGDGKPRCRVDLEVRSGEYVVVVNQLELGGSLREIDSIPVDVMKDTSVLRDRLMSEWGALSKYDIVNSDEFFESVFKVSPIEGEEERDDDSELDEEVELLQVIEEWSNDTDHPLSQRFLGESLIRLATLRLSLNKVIEVIELVEEGLGLLRKCSLRESGVRLYLARALTTKADVLLREKGSQDEVKILLEEAKNLVHSLTPDRSTEEVSEWINRLVKMIRM
jgi:hypothetical protein